MPSNDNHRGTPIVGTGLSAIPGSDPVRAALAREAARERRALRGKEVTPLEQIRAPRLHELRRSELVTEFPFVRLRKRTKR